MCEPSGRIDEFAPDRAYPSYFLSVHLLKLIFRNTFRHRLRTGLMGLGIAGSQFPGAGLGPCGFWRCETNRLLPLHGGGCDGVA